MGLVGSRGALKGCQGAVRLGAGCCRGGCSRVSGIAGWGCQAGSQWCPTSRGQLQDQHLPWLRVTAAGRKGSWKQGSAGAGSRALLELASSLLVWGLAAVLLEIETRCGADGALGAPAGPVTGPGTVAHGLKDQASSAGASGGLSVPRDDCDREKVAP